MEHSEQYDHTLPMERITVSLPAELIRQIDRLETNRSRFVQEAIRKELQRRRRELLRKSLDHPHAAAGKLADAGFADWANQLPETEGLVDPEGGTPVRWVPGRGWTTRKR
jgi:Arc/MetJ-type ribon-helix-helix transcriptional regulator